MNLDSPKRLAITLRMVEFFTSSTLSSPTGSATGATAGAASAFSVDGAAAFSAGVKFSMSFLTILPLSPVPFTSAKLMPFSSAIFLANGEAKIRCPSCVAGADSSLDDSSDALGAASLEASFLDAFLEEPPPACAFNTASTSVPSGPIMAKSESTGAPSPS